MGDEDLRLTGHCYCEKTKYEVEIRKDDPIFWNCYCHCESCRRAHAAPLFHPIAIKEERFKILSGEENINEFQKANKIIRAFCSLCGTRMYNKFPHYQPKEGVNAVVFFPATLDSSILKNMPDRINPKYNIHKEETILDVELIKTLSEGN